MTDETSSEDLGHYWQISVLSGVIVNGNPGVSTLQIK